MALSLVDIQPISQRREGGLVPFGPVWSDNFAALGLSLSKLVEKSSKDDSLSLRCVYENLKVWETFVLLLSRKVKGT